VEYSCKPNQNNFLKSDIFNISDTVSFVHRREPKKADTKIFWRAKQSQCPQAKTFVSAFF